MSHWEWHDVEVVSAGEGPAIVLRGGAAARAQRLGVAPGAVRVSLTHTRAQAGAVAIIDRDG